MNIKNQLADFCKEKGISFKEEVPMKNYTTFKIGGNASFMAFPKNAGEISEIYKFAKESNIRTVVLGNGSNMLVSDDGIDGCVIHLGKNMSEIKLISDNCVFAEAGASLSSLCIFAMEHGLSGMEFAYGIPGTVGGAVRMNAGAYGGEIKDVLTSCKCVCCGTYDVKELTNAESEFSYRHSVFCDCKNIAVSAVFTLEKGNPSEIKAKMNEFIQKRKNSQPLEFPNGGSTFKRPQGAFAAQLIDECGLKGYHVGDAYISEKHAGFAVNKGNATCKDMLELIKHVRDTVKNEKGYTLETEIEIIENIK